MTFFYHTFIFYPLYNAFVLLIDGLPFLDAGISLSLPIIIRLILFPLAKKSVSTQAFMREITPETEKIKEKYKDDKQKQSLETFALYKKYKLNPFFEHIASHYPASRYSSLSIEYFFLPDFTHIDSKFCIVSYRYRRAQ